MRTKISAALLFAAAAWGQTFDVATVKLSGEFRMGQRIGCKGGPGTEDPSRYICGQVPLSTVLVNAYGIQRYQLTAPQWADSLNVDITANVPAGTSKEQFRAMVRALLADRFGLKVHRETKEAQGYDLVTGKGGAKMKPATDRPQAGDVPEGPPGRDDQGFPVLPPGRDRLLVMKMGGPRPIVWERANETMDELAASLSNVVRRPIHNATQLDGKYEVRLNYSQELSILGLPQLPVMHQSGDDTADEETPTIFSSVQERLGLKLEPRKVSAEYVIVDHLEKTPVAN